MRVKTKRVIITCIVLFLAVCISAGNDNYYFRSLSIGNGLSHTTVTSILSDHNGQLWIGTAFGLNIYNGQDIKNYFHKKQSVTSLPNSYIVFITEDSTNNIWVSTMQGLVRYNPQNDDFQPPLPEQKIQAYTFCHTPDGVLFGGDNALYLFDTKKNTFNAQSVKLTTTTPVRIYSINEWKKGVYLLLLSNGDIKEYHLSSGELKPSVFQRQTNDITAIYIDKSQNLYTASYQHGITIYDKDGELKYRIHTGNSPLTSNAILDIREKDQKLWIATDGGGINKFNPDDRTFIHYPSTYNKKVISMVDYSKSELLVIFYLDGFLPNELAEIYQPFTCDKYMYLGGTYGLVGIDKSIKSDETPASDITLADVMLDGVSPFASQRDINKCVYKISIPWDYKSLQLKVIVLDKDIFKKRLFRFKIFKYAIKSNEVQISESYDPTLSLNMLSSGEYSVYISYYTDNGTWSSQKEILHLTVTTPWYKDFRVLSGIAILFFFFLYWRLMVYIRVKENKMKWKMNEVIQKNNQEKIDTLINISHELRTPLTLIYAPLKKLLENAHKSTDASEGQTDLKRQLISIHKSASQMKNIINMTLEISRMERKGDTLHRSPHAMNEWICSVAEGFEYKMEAKDIGIDYQLDKDISLVEFDDNKCESVLSNLLMNALKFSPEHSRIIISSQLTDKFVRIAVSDEGIGLDNLNHEQLFNRFYQGEHNRQGSGIGLSYSKILIQKHGGNIGAYNNSERGATFYFELPLLTLNDVQNSPEAVTLKTDIQLDTNTQMQSQFTTRPYSLVIVEDNNELREFLQKNLRSEFQTIYTAPNGEEALPIINDKMPDIIISDIMMPRMDGYTLCRQVKSNILTSHIPIVLLTARCDTDSTMTGYKTGADAYVPKPFEVEFLLTLLCNLLQNRELLKEKYRGNFIHASIGENESPLQTTNSDEEFQVKLNNLILENLSSKDINVKYLTEQMGMSRTPLYNKLKALTGMSVNDYINQLRIEKAAMLLSRTSLSIAEISAEVGFEYQKYFSTLFKQIRGVTPTQYRLLEQDKQANKDNYGN